MALSCSKCSKEATITLHVIDNGVEQPNVELCAACYAAFLPEGFSDDADLSGKPDRYIGISYKYRVVDQHGKPHGPPGPP
jgi:hypothetical protein